MFSDTITFTDLHGTDDYTVTRINQDGYSSEYLFRSSSRELRLTIRNVTYLDKKRGVNVDRHTVQLTETIFAVAPAVLSNIRKSYLVFENQQGDDPSAAVGIALGLCGFLTPSSGANLTKMVNFES